MRLTLAWTLHQIYIYKRTPKGPPSPVLIRYCYRIRSWEYGFLVPARVRWTVGMERTALVSTWLKYLGSTVMVKG